MIATDANEVRRAVRLIRDEGQVVELRALEAVTQGDRRPHTVSGYFDDVDKLVQATGAITRAKGIYIVLNPVNPALLARAVNRLRDLGARDASTTADHDIVTRRWLLVDADPRRPKDISSSNAEHEAALARARDIRSTLTAAGWPAPLLADSGNGAHLLYRLDLPVDDGDLVEHVLQALAFRFDDAQVEIDQKVFNPSRISKLYGTPAGKGDDTPDRPHRLSRILEVPDALQSVPKELLERLAASLPAEPPRPHTARQYAGEPFDLERWIVEHGLDVEEPRDWRGGKKWIFHICPWNGEHRDRSAYLLKFPSGAIAAGCHHNGCQGKDWHALRDLVEPGWQDRGGSPRTDRPAGYGPQAPRQAGYPKAGGPAPAAPATNGDQVQEILVQLSRLKPAEGQPDRSAVQKKARELVPAAAGLSKADLITVCDTLDRLGLTKEWVRNWQTAVNQARQRPANGGDDDRESQADTLVKMGREALLFSTPEGDLYAHYQVNSHHETWPIHERGSNYARWLTHRYYVEYNRAPSNNAVASAISVLEAEAQFGQQQKVAMRVAEHDGAVYLDLGDKSWQAVKITPQGWHLVQNPPVHFRRAKGMLPLPVPQPGGSIKALRPFINVANDDDWHLVLAWLIGALAPRGPYVQLAFYGERGSAKSTATRTLRSLIDPNAAMARSAPKEERDLAIAAKNSWVVAFDNVSLLPDWLSDALCRLSTGAASSTRALYTDDDEALFSAKRPVLLNGIEEVATRGDLLDRLITITLPPIPPDRRMSEREFDRLFEASQPVILGALLDAVSTALKNLPTTRFDQLPRMADFMEWVEAAGPALGLEPQTFLTAFGANQEDAVRTEIEASPLAAHFIELCEKRCVQGCISFKATAEELLHDLNAALGDGKEPARWPANARSLSGKLRRLAPALRQAGWSIDFDGREGTQRRRVIAVFRVASADANADAKSAADANAKNFASARSNEAPAEGQKTTSARTQRPQNPPHLPFSSARASVGFDEERAREDEKEDDGKFAVGAVGASAGDDEDDGDDDYEELAL